ncbi:MAG: prephenate dehydrogenase, partial [Thiohalorhabdaceae bacterium]
VEDSPLFQRAAVIGVGLIGGSLGWALRHHGLAGEVVGVEPDMATLERARQRGLIDRGVTDPAAGVTGGDLVVIAVPVGSFEAVLARAAAAIEPGALVTDVGSVKLSVQAEAERLLEGGPVFVGGHPIAGTEESGVEAALGDLFQGALCVVSVTEATPEWAVARLTTLWRAVGSQVVTMAPAEHDRVLAATSHLPHILAFALIQTFAALPERDRLEQFAAGGFRDLTRIAASDAVMWRDIALANRDPLLAMLDDFENQLGLLRQAIEHADGGALEHYFGEARMVRRGLSGRGKQ